MKLTIIIGSHQPGAQTKKVGHYLKAQLDNNKDVNEVGVIDLTDNPVPLWQNTYWEEGSELQKEIKPYMEELASSDGFITIAPEWGGMVPAGLKNFMLYWSEKETGHKPVMIVGISGSINGAYPISELRMSGYKNSKIVYTPEHLIVRNVSDMMNDHDPEGGEAFDKDIRARATFAIGVLVEYAQAFRNIRKNASKVFNKKYPFGM